MTTTRAVNTERETDFNTMSAARQPPNLKRIFKELSKAQRRYGKINDRDHLRGLAQKADKEYSRRGFADNFVRFLLNEKVLLEDIVNGSLQCFVFDEDRAGEILLACKEKRPTEAWPYESDAERISEFRKTEQVAEKENEPEAEIAPVSHLDSLVDSVVDQDPVTGEDEPETGEQPEEEMERSPAKPKLRIASREPSNDDSSETLETILKERQVLEERMRDLRDELVYLEDEHTQILRIIEQKKHDLEQEAAEAATEAERAQQEALQKQKRAEELALKLRSVMD